MEDFYNNSLLNAFILNQRKVNCLFRKQTGFSRTHVEILAFASTVVTFNPYQVQQYFSEMNIQQVRLGIRKLVSIGVIEIWSAGAKNRPAVYIITKKGSELLASYRTSWINNIGLGNAANC